MKLQEQSNTVTSNQVTNTNKGSLPYEVQGSMPTKQQSSQSLTLKQNKITIFSQAYPQIQGEQHLKSESSQSPNTITNPIKKQLIPIIKVQSSVHLKLRQINFNSDQHKQPITIRQFRQNDITELKKLHNEWFPLKYGDAFYKKITNKDCYCIVAETQIQTNTEQSTSVNKETEKIIIGAAVFEITDSQGYVYRSWSQSFMSLLSNVQDSIYIMTLGVIDEFRKNGVGKMLVNKILQIGKNYHNIKLVSLHVISYNKAAIHFYQKIGFTKIETLKNFYHVGNKQYNGQFYGIFINEGKLNTGWSLKLRKFLQ